MRICTLCKLEKSLENYAKAPHRKDGISCWCRECTLLKKKQYYQAHKVLILAKQKTYKEYNPEKVKLAKKRSTEAKKEQYSLKKKEWRVKNIERVLAKSAEYRAANRESLNLQQKARYRADSVRRIELAAAYYKRRYKTDHVFALAGLCRRRIVLALHVKKFSKKSTTASLLGCTAAYLKDYLESKFLLGMTWENRGLHGWHIDHIVPLASAKTEEELIALCHFTNLQPLWAAENYRKCAKMPHELTA